MTDGLIFNLQGKKQGKNGEEAVAGGVASLSVQGCSNEEPTLVTGPANHILSPNTRRLSGDVD